MRGWVFLFFYNHLLKRLSHFDVDSRVVSFKIQAVTGSVFRSVYTVYFNFSMMIFYNELLRCVMCVTCYTLCSFIHFTRYDL